MSLLTIAIEQIQRPSFFADYDIPKTPRSELWAAADARCEKIIKFLKDKDKPQSRETIMDALGLNPDHYKSAMRTCERRGRVRRVNVGYRVHWVAV